MDEIITYEKAEKIIKRLIDIKEDIPVSTYRLQMNYQFTFSQATSLIEYLDMLGISHIYSSPLLKALPGSNHGYDVIDHTRLNEEIGTEEEFYLFTEELKKRKMGLILDIVPNHMCTHYDNPIFRDILTHGRASRFADFMDINWEPVKKELKNKLLLPLLGDNFGAELENGKFELSFKDGRFLLSYYDNIMPIDPKTYSYILSQRPTMETFLVDRSSKDLIELDKLIYEFDNLPDRRYSNYLGRFQRYTRSESLISGLNNLYQISGSIRAHIHNTLTLINGKKGETASFNRLEELINLQSYRLANWKVAADEINYRRFFDINSLAAVRMERPEVLDYTHDFIFKLISEGRIQGLRIDHPDGLYNPGEYYINLQKGYIRGKFLKETQIDSYSPYYYKALELFEDVINQIEDKDLTNLYIVIEKILTENEQTPKNWAISGTVGYEYLNLINNLYIKRENKRKFTRIYNDFIGGKINYDNIVFEKKHMIMSNKMWSEVKELAKKLNTISEKDRNTRDFTLRQLQLALEDVVASFPVYRTYVESGDENLLQRDIRYIKNSINRAKKRTSDISPIIFDFIQDVLLGNIREEIAESISSLREDFVLTFQQLTSPIMAKGLEDTVFYIYNYLVSLNEVGGHPQNFGEKLEDFHKRVSLYLNNLPYSLISSSTHDTKRSEDVRARINVISEIPDEWSEIVSQFSEINKKYKTEVPSDMDIDEELFPDRNTEYLIYQTLVGSYPIEKMTIENRKAYFDRIWTYVQKAIREAKVYTNWINPNSDYEDACYKFLESILVEKSEFIKVFEPFQKKISAYGCWNSLSQLTIKTAMPGVIDIYQGNELWSFSLVDPDNRREVDYNLRIKLLKELLNKEKDKENLNQTLTFWLKEYSSGSIKLYFTYKGLRARKENLELFLSKEYIPIESDGKYFDNVVSFARRTTDKSLIMISSRYFTEIKDEDNDIPILGDKWKNTKLIIPEEIKESVFKDIYTDAEIKINRKGKISHLDLKEVFTNLPFAILISED